MMPPDLVRHLADPGIGEFHGKMLQKCKDLIKVSRDQMSTFYQRWDKYDMAYRSERYRDQKDVKAAERKEPEKMVVPLTYSQINTFVAFCYQVYTQRPTFFEMSGTGTEDIQAAKLAEATLEYNLDHNKWKGDKVQQFLLDIARFGLGVVKHSWVQETVKVEEQVPMQMGQVPGMTVMPPMTTQLVDKIKYQGNKLMIVSPYRFFPDPRIPLTRFQEGEFCGSEDEYSLHALKKMESAGLVAGVAQIPPVSSDMLMDGSRRLSFTDQVQNVQPLLPGSAFKEPKFCIVTEVQLEIIPSEWTVDGKPLGTSKDVEKYLCWYANDSRIIRFEPMGYLHDEYTYDLSQFNNDQIRFINFGVSEILEQIQDIQTWFINSRITSVRKVISNQLIVDPKGIDMQDLKDRNPVIRLKPGVQGSGVDRWIKQLELQDVTQNHLNDAKVMEDFGRQATGITENLLGQFSGGRRSATEARNVNNSAAARLLLTAYSIWETGILPMGRHMLSNIRSGMDVQQLVRIVGQSNAIANQQGIPQFLMADKTMLIGNYDFMIFDGTLPSQRGATAQTLQELLINLVQNPELVFVFGIDPRPLLKEILTLRGIRNIDQFQLTPQSAQQLISLVGAARNATATTNSPGGGGPASGGGPGAPAKG